LFGILKNIESFLNIGRKACHFPWVLNFKTQAESLKENRAEQIEKSCGVTHSDKTRFV